MNYWIIIDGQQRGPLTEAEIRALGCAPSTPVWREGLPDWTTIDGLPAAEAAALGAVPPLPGGQPVEVEVIVEEATVETVVDTETPPAIPDPAPQPDNHPWSRPLGTDPAGSYKQPEPAPAPAPGPMRPGETGPDCPAPTYLGWSVAATLLCCTVLGIVAIIYAVKVRGANDARDYAAAWRYSRTLELWLIAAIALGIVLSPLSMMFMM